MAKWYGKIGYELTEETEPGIWTATIIEKDAYGDLTKDYRKRNGGSEVNDSIDISNSISIIADPFAVENCSHMAYATFMGAKWKISSIDVQYPRLNLSLGGVYNNG